MLCLLANVANLLITGFNYSPIDIVSSALNHILFDHAEYFWSIKKKYYVFCVFSMSSA